MRAMGLRVSVFLEPDEGTTSAQQKNYEGSLSGLPSDNEKNPYTCLKSNP